MTFARCVSRSERKFNLTRIFLLLLLAIPGRVSAQTTPVVTLVQHAGKDAGTTTSSFLSFANPNTSGNWIAVCIRAGHAGEAFTVTDTNGNLYHRAVQFSVTSDVPSGDSLGVFYAENVAAGPNTVTVSDTLSATLRFAILEYSGVATANSLDGVAAAQGIGVSPNSGSVATSASGDLLLAAIVTSDPETFTSGTGYIMEERVPALNAKLMVEDGRQTVAGTISANASLSSSVAWGAAVAAFRSANAAGVLPAPVSVAVTPSATTLAPNAAQPFTATVQNDANNLGVSWALSGSGCTPPACGTLSSATPASVLYTAPATPPIPATVTLTATSLADGTKSASATLTISTPPPLSISISPSSTTVSPNLAQSFTATVRNDSLNQGVTWSLSGSGCSGVSCGMLSGVTHTNVTYTAPMSAPVPATVTLTATSVTNPTVSASAAITVSQGIPTSLGWFQISNTQLQPVCPNIPLIQGAIGCQGVIAAWSGGIADTKRNRLLFTGGGHENYWGNEIYSLNLTDLSLTRLNNPVFPSVLPLCSEDWGTPALAPPTPAPRENYSGLAYVAHLDKLWLFGGALASSGCRSTGMWMLDLPTLTWQRRDPTNGAQEIVYTDINYADYDPGTKLVYLYIANNDVLAAYNPDTNTMTELLNHNSYGVSAYATGVLDPKRRRFVILGGGFAGAYDLTTSPPAFSKFSALTVGCAALQGANYPGLAYDPVQDKIVGWSGGNTVYLFDSTTLTCTAVTYPGGPPAQQTNGTYGRWRYFPNLDVFALVNDWKQNAFTLRLTPAP